jgi:hypothetical protein
VSEETLGKLYETMQKDWAGQPMEPVAPQFIDPILAMPLPPLVGRDWGSDATHPDIPLAINAPPPVEELEPLAEQPAEQPVGDPDDPASFFRRDPNQPALSQRPGFPGAGMSRFPGAERAPFGRGFGGEFGMRGPGMPYGEGGYSREFATGPGGPRTGLPRGVDHMLLRFFDFSVEPGKKYKYRVKLVLVDPNHGLQDSALDPAVQDRLRASKKKDFRMVEQWSEPSPTVGIPLAGAVMLAEAKPANEKNFNDEPAIKLMVETFDVQDGTAVHVAKEKDFRRGAVVNLKEKMEYTGDGDRWIDTFDSYEIRTGVTVLDVTGGDRLSKDMSTPARMLVMHPSGEISIRKELDDSTSVAYLRALFAEDKQRAGEGFMPPYGLEMMPSRGGRER